jgi:hypothetical protein
MPMQEINCFFAQKIYTRHAENKGLSLLYLSATRIIVSCSFYFLQIIRISRRDYTMDNKDTSLTHDNIHIEPDTSGDIYME